MLKYSYIFKTVLYNIYHISSYIVVYRLYKYFPGKAANTVQVTKHINTIISHPVCPQTVRNVLKQHSFKAVTKKKKPLLTAVHRKKRLAFALRHKEWTVEDWKRGIWSDETKINRIG